ncbi:unnamed protein product [Ixodes pacificus]
MYSNFISSSNHLQGTASCILSATEQKSLDSCSSIEVAETDTTKIISQKIFLSSLLNTMSYFFTRAQSRWICKQHIVQEVSLLHQHIHFPPADLRHARLASTPEQSRRLLEETQDGERIASR